MRESTECAHDIAAASHAEVLRPRTIVYASPRKVARCPTQATAETASPTRHGPRQGDYWCKAKFRNIRARGASDGQESVACSMAAVPTGTSAAFIISSSNPPVQAMTNPELKRWRHVQTVELSDEKALEEALCQAWRLGCR